VLTSIECHEKTPKSRSSTRSPRAIAVMIAIAFDPVERGFVTSIARPTGNVTGLFFRRPELVEKQMEVLAETFPDRTRLGVFWDAVSADLFYAAERAASSLRLQLRHYEMISPTVPR
jgi:putative ABC transport system substrate-binding protein